MKELSRYEVLKKLINKEINGTEAASQIGVSTRHTRRLKKLVITYGAAGLAHKNRGRKSNRAILEKTKSKTIEHIKKKYSDFGPTLTKEKLEELHGIHISVETIRHIMIKEGIWSPKQRKSNKEYRTWRQRKEHYGDMEQFDGSYHKWFEKRAPECCLLAAIDDARGTITHAMFTDNESVHSVFGFWKEYVREKGKPISIYLDKYSTYKINHKSAVDNSELITQFERAMRQLDIKPITAHSPEAKGRIERLFKTLQDRLIKEMRLYGISDIETANVFLKNEYIPWFNKKFGVAPASNIDIHRTLCAEEQKKLDEIFSVHSMRNINRDFTVRFKNKWFQLLEIQPTLVLRTDKVRVEEHLDGTIRLMLNGKYLDYVVLPERPKRVNMKPKALTKTKSSWIPPINHPWRKGFAKERQTRAALK